METAALLEHPLPDLHTDPRLRRVSLTWALLFFDTLAPSQASALHIPHRVAEVLSQGALLVALLLAMTINPRIRIRPNWFLGLYSVLAVTSFMMSVRLVGVGTEYRSVRLIVFVFVLWLLTPWWGRRDLLLLRCQLNVLLVILASVVVSVLVSPGSALQGGRLSDTIWPIWPTGVAHFAGELVGLTSLLWLCRLVSHRRALVLVVPATIILVMSHTRTALVALAAGLLVAGASLLLARRRVRRALVGAVIVVVLIGIPASPFLVHWLARGENAQGISDLSGRTNAWSAVLSEHRPTTNVIFGNGLSNDAVTGASNRGLDGLPIDSSWISIYQDQGIVGDALVGAVVLLLLLTALCRTGGPTRALALFLIVYCPIAGITETGLGGVSPYLLDLTIAASLIALPSASGTDLTFNWRRRRLATDPWTVEARG